MKEQVIAMILEQISVLRDNDVEESNIAIQCFKQLIVNISNLQS